MTDQLIDSFIHHSLIDTFIHHSLIDSFIHHSLIDSFIHHSLIDSFIHHSLIDSFIHHSLTDSFIHHSLIDSFIYSFDSFVDPVCSSSFDSFDRLNNWLSFIFDLLIHSFVHCVYNLFTIDLLIG